MKWLRNAIVKSNDWYDNLKDPWHLLFFLFVIMGSLIGLQYYEYVVIGVGKPWGFLVWVSIFLFWRGGNTLIKVIERWKKLNSEE